MAAVSHAGGSSASCRPSFSARSSAEFLGALVGRPGEAVHVGAPLAILDAGHPVGERLAGRVELVAEFGPDPAVDRVREGAHAVERAPGDRVV